MPAVSRFGGGGNARAEKKAVVIEKLKAFFEKYLGIGNSFKASEGMMYSIGSEGAMKAAESVKEYN